MRVAGLVIPRLPRPALQVAVAIVGAGIMPANFYLHSALVHSRCDLTRKFSLGQGTVFTESLSPAMGQHARQLLPALRAGALQMQVLCVSRPLVATQF